MMKQTRKLSVLFIGVSVFSICMLPACTKTDDKPSNNLTQSPSKVKIRLNGPAEISGGICTELSASVTGESGIPVKFPGEVKVMVKSSDQSLVRLYREKSCSGTSHHEMVANAGQEKLTLYAVFEIPGPIYVEGYLANGEQLQALANPSINVSILGQAVGFDVNGLPDEISIGKAFSFSVTVLDIAGKPAVSFEKPVEVSALFSAPGSSVMRVNEKFKEMLVKGEVSQKVKDVLLELPDISPQAKEAIRGLKQGVPAPDMANNTILSPEIASKLETVLFPGTDTGKKGATLIGKAIPKNGVAEFKDVQVVPSSGPVHQVELIFAAPGVPTSKRQVPIKSAGEMDLIPLTIIVNGVRKHGTKVAENKYEVDRQVFVLEPLPGGLVRIHGKKYRKRQESPTLIYLDSVH